MPKGQAFRTLSDMEVAMGEVGEGTLRHRAGGTRNDFSNWVRDVIGDEKLSRDIQNSNFPDKQQKAVTSRIAWLRSRI